MGLSLFNGFFPPGWGSDPLILVSVLLTVLVTKSKMVSAGAGSTIAKNVADKETAIEGL
jgi:hypothetical protein